ncbi:hypothetical protein BaRGS_00032042 [Batillaria attramentaria]|uniref:Uncharacterized protein n=1 Tax=Batillaria attramentaria TaxID=370345 RepID=A0ABD0JNV1_9CAEN
MRLCRSPRDNIMFQELRVCGFRFRVKQQSFYDRNVLTKKSIRKQYQAHFKRDSVNHEEKQRINQALDAVLQELAESQKVFPTLGSAGESSTSVSPEQGKENLHASNAEHVPDSASSSSRRRQKLTHRVPRFELGQQHQKRIRLSLKRDTTGTEKNTASDRPFCDQQEATEFDTAEANQSLKNRARSNATSVSAEPGAPPESSLQDDLQTDNSEEGSHRTHPAATQQLGISTVSEDGEEGPSGVVMHKNLTRTKQLASNLNSESSEDSVNLLTCGSESENSLPASGESLSKNEKPRGKFSGSATFYRSPRKGLSSAERDVRGKTLPSPRKKMKRRGPRMLNLESVLSAIMDSDDDADQPDDSKKTKDERDDCGIESDSPLKSQKVSPRTSKFQDSNIFERFSMEQTDISDVTDKRKDVQDFDHTLVAQDSEDERETTLTRSKGLGCDNCSPDDVGFDEDNSNKDTPSQSPEIVSGNSPVFRFRPETFFGKANKKKRQSNSQKLKAVVINSDSELSCDSVPNPVSSAKLVTGRDHVTTLTETEQNTFDSDSDDFSLSTLAARQTAKATIRQKKKYIIASDSEGGTPVKVKRTPPWPQKKTKVKKAAKAKRQVGTYSKRKKFATDATSDKFAAVATSGSEKFAAFDDSDEEVPLARLKGENRASKIKERRSLARESHACKSKKVQPEHKFSLFESTSDTSEPCIVSPDFHFSPPGSHPVKRGKRGKSILAKLRNTDSCGDEKQKYAVYSVSDSTEEEALPLNKTSIASTSVRTTGSGNIGGEKVVRKKETDGEQSEHSVYTLSDSTEDGSFVPWVTSSPNTGALKMKLKRQVEVNNNSESEPWELHSYDGQHLPDVTVALEDVLKHPNLCSKSESWHSFAGLKPGYTKHKYSAISDTEKENCDFAAECLLKSQLEQSEPWSSREAVHKNMSEGVHSHLFSLKEARNLLQKKRTKEKTAPQYVAGNLTNHQAYLKKVADFTQKGRKIESLPALRARNSQKGNLSCAKKTSQQEKPENVSRDDTGFSSEDDAPLAEICRQPEQLDERDCAKSLKGKIVREIAPAGESTSTSSDLKPKAEVDLSVKYQVESVGEVSSDIVPSGDNKRKTSETLKADGSDSDTRLPIFSSEDDLPLAVVCEAEIVQLDELNEKPKKRKAAPSIDSSDEEQHSPAPKKKKMSPVPVESSDNEDSLSADPESETETGVEDGASPAEKSDGESELDTSSLSSDDGGDENDVQRGPKSHPKAKVKSRKRSSSPKKKSPKPKVSKKPASSEGEKEEDPYLKRLRVICRKVGIFVRNDIHFAGCTTDREKIQRLKEALRKAGMKGQPSLSKVDSVNLKREAADLDTSNIIETSGRPRRQPKGLFTRGESPKKSLTPVKQQFSRIQDLITDSDSD